MHPLPSSPPGLPCLTCTSRCATSGQVMVRTRRSLMPRRSEKKECTSSSSRSSYAKCTWQGQQGRRGIAAPRCTPAQRAVALCPSGHTRVRCAARSPTRLACSCSPRQRASRRRRLPRRRATAAPIASRPQPAGGAGWPPAGRSARAWCSGGLWLQTRIHGGLLDWGTHSIVMSRPELASAAEALAAVHLPDVAGVCSYALVPQPAPVDQQQKKGRHADREGQCQEVEQARDDRYCQALLLPVPVPRGKRGRARTAGELRAQRRRPHRSEVRAAELAAQSPVLPAASRGSRPRRAGL